MPSPNTQSFLSGFLGTVGESILAEQDRQHKEKLLERKTQLDWLNAAVSSGQVDMSDPQNRQYAEALIFGKGGKGGKGGKQQNNPGLSLFHSVVTGFHGHGQPQGGGQVPPPVDGSLQGAPQPPANQIPQVPTSLDAMPSLKFMPQEQIDARTAAAAGAKEQATQKAFFDESQREIDELVNKGGISREDATMQVLERKVSPQTPKWRSGKQPVKGSDLVSQGVTQDHQGNPIRPDAFYQPGDLGKSEVWGLTSAPNAPDPFKGMPASVREYANQLQKDHPDWDHEQIVSAAVDRDVTEKMKAKADAAKRQDAAAADRRTRLNQYLKSSGQQMELTGERLKELKDLAPYVVEAKKLGLETAQLKLEDKSPQNAQNLLKWADSAATKLVNSKAGPYAGDDLKSTRDALLKEFQLDPAEIIANAKKASAPRAPASGKAPAADATVPAPVKTALKDYPKGRYTLSDGSVWTVGDKGSITNVSPATKK